MRAARGRGHGSLLMVALLLTVTTTAWMMPCSAATDVEAETDLGKVIGTIDAGTRVESYLGIYYAADTADENRFMPPKERAHYPSEGLDARSFRAGCVQAGNNSDVPQEQSEDCLHLNVYVKRPAKSTAKLPVAVFFHGGAFKQGCNVGPFGLYDASFVADHGNIVVVAPNYRLGALGWLATSEEGGVHGNMGYLDQVAALKWVQRNIAHFNGDPDAVTIWGESAGAMSSLVHMSAEMSKGLFRYAIQESNPFGFVYRDIKQSTGFGDQFVKHLECTGKGIQCLQAADVQQIRSASIHAEDATSFIEAILHGSGILGDFLDWTPTWNTPELPNNPFEPSSIVSDVPLLYGQNSNEGATFIYDALKKPFSSFDYKLALDAIFGDYSKMVYEKYPPSPATDARAAFSRVVTDYLFTCTGQRRGLQLNADAYFYHYDHMASFQKALWPPYGLPWCIGRVCHGAELPFVFHNTGINTSWAFDEQEERLSSDIVELWTTFVKTGSPVISTDAFRWPALENSTLQNVVFAKSVSVSTETRKLCEFWKPVIDDKSGDFES
eukprot:g1240.t1